jgi:hypothetical protein
MDRGTRKRRAEMAIEERGAVMCRERERKNRCLGFAERERGRTHRGQEEKGFFL